MKTKILFCNFDMKGGGAEKVLVNLLQGLNPEKYDITLFLLFGVGVHLSKLPPNVRVKCLFRHQFSGLTSILKLFSPQLLHRLFIREHYDVEIAYLETSPTRIISGAPKQVKKVAWVHVDEEHKDEFRAFYRDAAEMERCYNRFDKIAFVSKTALRTFEAHHPGIKTPKCVLYNVNDISDILLKAQEPISEQLKGNINICTIGRLTRQKAYGRLLQVVKELNDLGLAQHFTLYILGTGEDEEELNKYIKENRLGNVVMLGFQANPYKYLSRMDLFVCSSIKEGYSTAVTEAILVDVPVITTDCSGMDEILEDGKYGMIVPNSKEALSKGLRELIENPEAIKQYKQALRKANKPSQTDNLRKYEELIDSL